MEIFLDKMCLFIYPSHSSEQQWYFLMVFLYVSQNLLVGSKIILNPVILTNP